MFVRRVPIFQRGDILRKEMLSELSETFYLSEDLKYTGYSDGILYGCNLSTTETAILINPGAIYKGQKVFLLKDPVDRKSTRLNSSHVSISYAVYCLKKK